MCVCSVNTKISIAFSVQKINVSLKVSGNDDLHGCLGKKKSYYLFFNSGLSLRALWICMMHTGYFLLAAVLLSFLQCPTFSRVSLLIIVPINAIAEVNQQSAFDLVTLSLLLFTLSLG